MSDENVWFVVKNGERIGPLTENRFLELVKTGKININDYVWSNGFSDWTKAENVDMLKIYFNLVKNNSIMPVTKVAKSLTPRQYLDEGKRKEVIDEQLFIKNLKNIDSKKSLGRLSNNIYPRNINTKLFVFLILTSFSILSSVFVFWYRSYKNRITIKYTQGMPIEAVRILNNIYELMNKEANLTNLSLFSTTEIENKINNNKINNNKYLSSNYKYYINHINNNKWSAMAVAVKAVDQKFTMIRINKRGKACYIYDAHNKTDDICPQKTDGSIIELTLTTED